MQQPKAHGRLPLQPCTAGRCEAMSHTVTCTEIRELRPHVRCAKPPLRHPDRTTGSQIECSDSDPREVNWSPNDRTLKPPPVTHDSVHVWFTLREGWTSRDNSVGGAGGALAVPLYKPSTNVHRHYGPRHNERSPGIDCPLYLTRA